MNQTEDRKHGIWFWCCCAIAIYVVSTIPAVWLASQTWFPDPLREVVGAIYVPIIWLAFFTGILQFSC